MLRAALSLLSISLMCVSCNGAAIEPSQSLVGAKALPSANILAREAIYLTRGGVDFGDSLTYEWRPDNSLLIRHTFFSKGPGASEAVRGQETLHVSTEVAAQARQLLWRVRPAELEGVDQEARPTGCERRGPHDFGEVTVGFVNEGDASGVEDDQIGIFELPTTESCSTSAAVEARAVVRRALQLLPESKVATAFERSS
jgi:hypothetical protein